MSDSDEKWQWWPPSWFGVLAFVGMAALWCAVGGAIYKELTAPPRPPHDVVRTVERSGELYVVTMCDGSEYVADVRASRILVTDAGGRDQYIRGDGCGSTGYTTDTGRASIAAVQRYRAEARKEKLTLPCP